MAEKHELNIIINKSGEVELKVEGVKGSKCIKLTEDLEKELGEIISMEKTSDFYNEDTDVSGHIKTNS